MPRNTINTIVALITTTTAFTMSPAHAAVIFGDGFGNGVSANSTSTAQVKSPANANAVTNTDSLPAKKASALPIAPFTVSSSASATDSDTLGGVYSAQANNLITAAFDSVRSAVVTFTGNASASETRPGLAQAASAYAFEYSFTLTDANPFTLNLLYSANNLGCCGNQVSLQNRNTGQFVFFNNNYGADNSFNYNGNLIAGIYKLTIAKGEGYFYDAPSFNGSGTGTRANSHNDRVAFTIGALDTPAVPEPATWAMMIAGIGLVGGAMRQRRARPAAMAV